MPKLLFLVTEDWYFCSHRLPLAVAARDIGFEVVVVTRLTNHRHVIENAGVRTVPLLRMKRSSMNIMRELASFIELISIFRHERPDLIHLVALKPVIYGALAARMTGIPARVNALGGLGFIFTSNRFVARLLRPMLLRIFRYIFNDTRSRLILQNEHDLNLMTCQGGVDRHNTRLIRGAGVDLSQYMALGFPKGVPICMLASRMLWDKGVGEFVNAARILQGQGTQARFVLVGDPDRENPSSVSQAQLQEWHDSGVVEWWGYQNNMPKVLALASVVCLPTYYGEGIPKILLEAMCCARPIVTTDMPGCRELVYTGKNGMLIKPRDPIGLANALKTILCDPSNSQKMGDEGRRIVEERYSLSRVVEETIDVYQELLSCTGHTWPNR